MMRLVVSEWKGVGLDAYIPFVIFVPATLKDEIIWPVQRSAAYFFIYQSTVHFYDYDGSVFFRTKEGWTKKAWKFKAHAQVIQSDDFVIACSSPAVTKADTGQRSCYAPEKHWDINFVWDKIDARICNHKLTVLATNNKPPFAVYEYEPMTGQLLAKKEISKRVDNICAVKFD